MRPVCLGAEIFSISDWIQDKTFFSYLKAEVENKGHANALDEFSLELIGFEVRHSKQTKFVTVDPSQTGKEF